MIQELVEVWAWFWGMVAGWGATTIGLSISIVVLYVKHFRLRQQVTVLYNQLVASERECSLRHNRDRS